MRRTGVVTSLLKITPRKTCLAYTAVLQPIETGLIKKRKDMDSMDPSEGGPSVHQVEKIHII